MTVEFLANPEFEFGLFVAIDCNVPVRPKSPPPTKSERPPADEELIDLIDELIRTMDGEDDDDGPTERMVMMRLDTRPPIIRERTGPTRMPLDAPGSWPLDEISSEEDDEIALSEDSMRPTEV